MRENRIQTFGQLTKVAFKSQNINDATNKQQLPLTKSQLWKAFKVMFYNMHSKQFKENEQTIKNIKIMFYYYLKDPEFFNCSNLIKGLNTPSFNKGLLIIGGVGTGKTDYFRVFENIFMNYRSLRFKMYDAKLLVRSYEKCLTPNEKEYFFMNKNRNQLCIDDIGSEKNASNYGIYNVVEGIISERYARKLVTHATTNFSSINNDVEMTLRVLGDRYGHRVYDRLFEMFNIIVFSGSSLRT